MGEYAGRVRLYHADLYRLEDSAQVWELGLDEISADGILVVEWPERAPEVLPEDHLEVRFTVISESERELTLEPHGARAEAAAAAMSQVVKG
jgi:tRNA threonylcarbamoyladenosine biosynthesis protein TsaE